MCLSLDSIRKVKPQENDEVVLNVADVYVVYAQHSSLVESLNQLLENFIT